MIEHLDSMPVVLLLYHAGSSGEFLAHAISQSMDSVTRAQAQWEKQTRCKYRDFLGRTLNCLEPGFVIADDTVIESRIQAFFQSAVDIRQQHIALMHPHPKMIEFVQTRMPNSAVIEITCCTEESQKFKFLASRQKIQRNINQHAQYSKTPWPCVYTARNHLQVEWSNVFLHQPQMEFQRIATFLQTTGNSELFLDLLQDYIHRNQHIVNDIPTLV